MDRFKNHTNAQIDNGDQGKRRPSAIAEQAMMHSGKHPRGPSLVNTKKGTFSRTTDCVTPPVKVVLGQCDSQASTNQPCAISKLGFTSVGKHSKMTTSIDEGVDSDMSDKDSEAGSSSLRVAQPTTGLRPSRAFSDLSQTQQMCSDQSISTGSPFTSLDSNLEADLLSSLSSCSGGVPSTNSPTSPAAPRNIAATITPPISSKFQHYGPVVQPTSHQPLTGHDRAQTHSPVSFREGRRASDSLMAQGVIAFRQRLKDGKKTRGVAELRKEMEILQGKVGGQLPQHHQQQIQLEHSEYKKCLESSKAPPPRQWSLDEDCGEEKQPIRKRSLPNPGKLEIPHLLTLKNNFNAEQQLNSGSSGSLTGGEDVVPVLPPSLLAAADCSTVPSIPGGLTTTNGSINNKSLHHQVLHHHWHQKRHNKQICVTTPVMQKLQQLQLDPNSSQLVPSSESEHACGVLGRTLLQPSIPELSHEEDNLDSAATYEEEGPIYSRPGTYPLEEEKPHEVEEEGATMDTY